MSKILLPANATDQDVCAAVEGVMADVLPCKVLTRVPEPEDLATAYERVGFGKSGAEEYEVFHCPDRHDLLHIAGLGYFTVSLD